jgi:RNA polymerase sigma-70 factor (ECF subfamily)
MIETIPLSWKSLMEYASVAPADSMRESGLDVAACVERVRQRDEDAARALLNHLYPLVIKLVRAHLPRRTSEEDLIQIVFMKVFVHLDRYSGAVPLEHWVSRIAINACLTQLKAERSRPEFRWADLSQEHALLLEAVPAADAQEDPGRALAARELVENLLGTLAPHDRLLLTLLHLEGHSIEEIKRITGWNSALIRVRAFRARQKLRKSFKRLMREERP